MKYYKNGDDSFVYNEFYNLYIFLVIENNCVLSFL